MPEQLFECKTISSNSGAKSYTTNSVIGVQIIGQFKLEFVHEFRKTVNDGLKCLH